MNALVVSGSRYMTCAQHCIIVANACEAFVTRYWRPDVVIHGACRDHAGNPAGADWMGEHWAQASGIRVERFEVTRDEWKRLGRKAGPRRNLAMLERGLTFDRCGVVAVSEKRTGTSGTRNMWNQATFVPSVDVLAVTIDLATGDVLREMWRDGR